MARTDCPCCPMPARNASSPAPWRGDRTALAAFFLPLLAPATAFAQNRAGEPFRLMDLVLLLILGGISILIWQWYRWLVAEQGNRALLERLIAMQQETMGWSGAGESSSSSMAVARLDELRNTQLHQNAFLEGLQEALIMTISRLEELRKETHASAARLNEARGAGAETLELQRSASKSFRELGTRLDRLHTTQSGLLSAIEALKAHERQDSSLLSALQAEVVKLNERVQTVIEGDFSLDPTVLGEPEGGRKLEANEAHVVPLRNLLATQRDAIEAQRRLLEEQGQQLAQLLEDLENQQVRTQRELSG